MHAKKIHKRDSFLQNLKVHSSWESLLTPKVRKLLIEIESSIVSSVKPYTPNNDKVLRFLTLPLDQVKIIILGQDPYPQPGVATGRAFEVGTLNSWEQTFSNISLKNILRSLYQAYYRETLKYSELKLKMTEGKFLLAPPNQLFSLWEQQGVLLLNTSFTCEVGKPGSHSSIWEPFTQELIRFLADKQEITWFLWGNHAHQITRHVEIKNCFKSQHPMMCYAGPGRETDFLFGKINMFAETRELVDWLSKEN